MLGLLAFAALSAVVQGLRVAPGGPGDAMFIGYMQGMYMPAFPLPEHTVTVELWSKLLPVRPRPLQRQRTRLPLYICDFSCIFLLLRGRRRRSLCRKAGALLNELA